MKITYKNIQGEVQTLEIDREEIGNWIDFLFNEIFGELDSGDINKWKKPEESILLWKEKVINSICTYGEKITEILLDQTSPIRINPTREKKQQFVTPDIYFYDGFDGDGLSDGMNVDPFKELDVDTQISSVLQMALSNCAEDYQYDEEDFSCKYVHGHDCDRVALSNSFCMFWKEQTNDQSVQSVRSAIIDIYNLLSGYNEAERITIALQIILALYNEEMNQHRSDLIVKVFETVEDMIKATEQQNRIEFPRR